MNLSILLKYEEILGDNQRELIPYFGAFRDMGFYLAGGTALSLMAGHRESEDFDFFCAIDFETDELLSRCREVFAPRIVTVVLTAKNTLWISVNGVKISFFVLHAPLTRPLRVDTYLSLASIDDIAGMKLGAILQRATEKDYIDMAYILHHMRIDDVLSVFEKKYGNIISRALLVRSLIYFSDVMPAPIRIIDPEYTYEKSQQFLIETVKKYLSE